MAKQQCHCSYRVKLQAAVWATVVFVSFDNVTCIRRANLCVGRQVNKAELSDELSVNRNGVKIQVGAAEKYSCDSPVQAIELLLRLTYHIQQLKRIFMSDTVFTIPMRVYYEDTDAGGIVYYANYLKFFERARTEWLRALGIEQDSLLSKNVAFVVAKVLMDNKKPARFNELLTVSSQISTLKHASIVFAQAIHNSVGDMICTAEIKVACIALQEMKARAIPAEVTEVLKRGR